jgi:transcriptional regulator with XRE-family HTH domain
MNGIRTISSLGATIRGARKSSGLTQAELAVRSGLSRATIIKIESGSRYDISSLIAAMKALGLEMSIIAVEAPRTSFLDDTEEL